MFRQLRAALRAGIVTERPAAPDEIEALGTRLGDEIRRRVGRSQSSAPSCSC